MEIIKTGQRTDSRLSQNNINVSEESKDKNQNQNYIEKENKTEQKTSSILEYYSSYMEAIKKDQEKEKEKSKIKKVIDAGNIISIISDFLGFQAILDLMLLITNRIKIKFILEIIFN